MIVDGRNHLARVCELIREYTDSLGRDLAFQHLDEELAHPENKYTPPNGELLVALHEGRVVGMVAYHRLSAAVSEMKRLYVVPDARGQGLGERLVEGIVDRARAAGFRQMVLDTLTSLHAARHLYKKFGFEVCAPYYDNPMPDVLYMKKCL